MCLCKCGKFATQVLFSVQVMALGSTNSEVNRTAGEVIFLETKLLIVVSSALLAIWPPRKTINEVFVFEPAFLHLNTKKHKPSSKSHSIYVPQAQQNSLQSALHRAAKYIPWYNCSSTFVSTRVRQRKQAGMKEQVRCCGDEPCAKYGYQVFNFLCSFFLFLRCMMLC